MRTSTSYTYAEKYIESKNLTHLKEKTQESVSNINYIRKLRSREKSQSNGFREFITKYITVYQNVKGDNWCTLSSSKPTSRSVHGIPVASLTCEFVEFKTGVKLEVHDLPHLSQDKQELIKGMFDKGFAWRSEKGDTTLLFCHDLLPFTPAGYYFEEFYINFEDELFEAKYPALSKFDALEQICRNPRHYKETLIINKNGNVSVQNLLNEAFNFFKKETSEKWSWETDEQARRAFMEGYYQDKDLPSDF